MNTRTRLAAAVAVTGALAVAGTAAVAGGGKQMRASLSGHQEVPAVITGADGNFRATVNPTHEGFSYRLTYSGIEGSVTQAHIHVGQELVNGGISVWVCSNLNPPGATPPGTQACPAKSGTVEGTIDMSDVVGPATQGVAPGELADLMRAIRDGLTYANVHSTMSPGGEIRGQIRSGGGHGRDDD